MTLMAVYLLFSPYAGFYEDVLFVVLLGAAAYAKPDLLNVPLSTLAIALNVLLFLNHPLLLAHHASMPRTFWCLNLALFAYLLFSYRRARNPQL